MKFAGLFTKTPNHKRFNYTPRHYDPREEELREREEKIKREIEAGLRQEKELELHRSRIKGSFQHARKRSIQVGGPSTAILRTLITLFIVIELWAYLQFGNKAFYGLFLTVPFYLFLKLKNFKKN